MAHAAVGGERMAAAAAAAGRRLLPSCRSCRSVGGGGGDRCCSCCWIVAYVAWIWICEYTALWSRFTEVDWECAHPPLPENQSGLRVLVAGPAKTGTRTLARSLHQIGLNHSYHSEDFAFFVWAKLSDAFWLERSGGRWSSVPLPGSFFNPNDRDLQVLAGTPAPRLAAALARCRVDALALDGLERLAVPLLEVSPGAKVVALSWRPYDEWRRSLDGWIVALLFELAVVSTFFGAAHALPWHCFSHLVRDDGSSPIRSLLESGGPPICQVYDVPALCFHAAQGTRRIVSRFFSGLPNLPSSETEYAELFDEIRAAVPKENLLEFDVRTGTFEELCTFLEIKPCPMSGRLPRARNSFASQRDFPVAFAFGSLITGAIHWINIKLIGLFFRCLRAIAAASAAVAAGATAAAKVPLARPSSKKDE